MSKLLGRGSAKLFTVSENNSEYKAMIRTLTGENKSSDLSPETMNDALLDQTCKSLSTAKQINIIHDPSDIRKPHSKKTENLGQVRDLSGNVINGYSTHNAIAIVPNDKAVHLLSHMSYSNKDPKFLKRDFIDKLEKGEEFEGDKEAKALYESGDYFNKKTVSLDEIEKIGKSLKSANPEALVTHILDREFDNNDYLNLVDKDLEQDFIIRSKKSRTLDTKGDDGKKVRLINADFDSEAQKPFQNLKLAKQCIQDGKMIISWGDFDGYNAVKIKVEDRDGARVFKSDMLLLTNKKISTLEDAYQVYMTYLSRAKIECVFKFLKEGLGWEEMQIRDFKAIQNLLSICFYVASYLYEVGKEKAYDDYAILLSDLGGGKGRITRHFITQGIRELLNYYRIGRMLKDKEVSQEQQNEMCEAFEMTL